MRTCQLVFLRGQHRLVTHAGQDRGPRHCRAVRPGKTILRAGPQPPPCQKYSARRWPAGCHISHPDRGRTASLFSRRQKIIVQGVRQGRITSGRRFREEGRYQYFRSRKNRAASPTNPGGLPRRRQADAGGTVTYRDGVPTGALPGKLVRGTRRAPTDADVHMGTESYATGAE